MNIKDLAKEQYERIVDKAYERACALRTPPEGWLRTTRKALGIPPKVIYRRLGISKNEFFRTERAEAEGAISLQKLRLTAEAMGCELHYAVVPKDTVGRVIENKARKHAEAMLKTAAMHMAMEQQATTAGQIENQVEKVVRQLIKDQPEWFWDDTHDYKQPS